MNKSLKLAQERVLRLDEAGKRVAAKRIRHELPSGEAIRNSWVAEMYEAIELGGGRVRNVIIDRTGMP